MIAVNSGRAARRHGITAWLQLAPISAWTASWRSCAAT